MAPSPDNPSSVGSSDFSDEYSSQESLRRGSVDSTTGPPAIVSRANRNEYSDDHIKLLYDIVVRAQNILVELSPSSRLPTHALFKAYDEILPENGLDPDEDRHISKLVFMVGGVKNKVSLMEKFKTVLARMDITIAFDGAQIPESDADDDYTHSGYSSNHSSDSTDTRMNDIRPVDRVVAPIDDATRRDDIEDDETNDGISQYEQQLAKSAMAFRALYHTKFATVTAIRRWQEKSYYIGNICDQFDAARQADLEDGVEDKFETWRAVAAEAEEEFPQGLPPNVYSKHTERMAIRAHEIYATRNALTRWRRAATERQCRKTREEDEQEPMDPLARLAAKTHRNLVLSRAFANWANRSEEESGKAQMAAKAYEMSLKSKIFGIRLPPIQDTQTSKAPEDMPAPTSSNNPALVHVTSAGRPIPADTQLAGSHGGVVPVAPAPVGVPVRLKPVPIEHVRVDNANDARVSTSVAAPGVKSVVVDPTATSSCRPTGTEIKPPAGKNIASEESNDPFDEVDERTLLARRHILRMRFFEAWESYTADNLSKVKEFESEQQDERAVHTIREWRDKSASRGQQDLVHQAERANFYNKTMQALPIWRHKAEQAVQQGQQVLEHYAERANYYYKTTKALPIWRSRNFQAQQRQRVHEHYAAGVNFYNRITEALPVWRAKAKETSETRQQLEHYSERADYYYQTRETLLAWHSLSKQKRKEKLKEAHLETRRIVKRGMGQCAVAEWREKLQPSFQKFEVMNASLEEVIADREWRQTAQVLDKWRSRAQEKHELTSEKEAMVKQKALDQWREKTEIHEEMQAEADEHWEERAASRALRSWNLSALQNANRPGMVTNALEKKDRRLLRQGFEGWYGRTADKLVPVELPDGSYKSIDQVVEDTQYQRSQTQARGLFRTWKEAAKNKGKQVEEEPYAPTPGRPQILLGSLDRMGTTTPLAPVPSRAQWQARGPSMGGSEMGARASRSGRSKRNLRVSWAA